MVQSNLQPKMVFVVLYGLSVIKVFSWGLPGKNLTAANAQRIYDLFGNLQKGRVKKALNYISGIYLYYFPI